MKRTQACFLWHMHQPYYTDPVAGFASMPWVRLHATKAYYDMACMIERFPSIKATFNFTPSLLIQLQELSSGSAGDLFLHYAQRPAGELTPSERAFIIRHFFAANWSTMVRPFPRYHELLVKRGLDVRQQPLDRLAAQFTAQELLDIQVWHNLTWFGYGMMDRYPRLGELRAKDRGFTEEEKQEVLALQHQAVGEIIPFYRRLAETGRIELTTSPFYHPILPLLIDTEFARRSRPEALLPSRFQAPADAETQIRNAVALHREVFGAPPAGLWPSEGSVCPELIPMLRAAGLQWTATDEGVLARSLGGWDRPACLYQPYLAGQPGQDVRIVFRDREISDAFGFVYAKLTPEAAVEDVLRRLRGIAEQAPGEPALVPIILDGENPWEHYHDGGERFLSGLYGALAGDGAPIITDTMSGALAAHAHPKRLEHLHSGSWINQDFKIWIGHPEDNRAWDLVRLTRARLANAAGTLSPDQARGAWEELYAAEGSDWCWWYGDDFETDYKPEFDRLFRTHLRNVYLRAGLPVPDVLNEPLIGARETRPFHLPVALLSPVLDGRVSDFFEWHGAGTIDPAPPLGAMWKSQNLFAAIHFGFSVDALFLRLDPGEELAAGTARAEVELHVASAAGTYKLGFSLDAGGPDTFTLSGAADGSSWTEVGRYGTICRRRILELAVPFKDLRLQAGQEFKISLAVLQNGVEVERYPRQKPVTLTVPDENYEATTWRV
jgi:alpha-amylase/alpha-mannosidase (GH57 family)